MRGTTYSSINNYCIDCVFICIYYRGSLSNKGISYQKLFIMINALWDPLCHTIPCVKVHV